MSGHVAGGPAPLRIGLIGAGGIARTAHLPAYRDAGWPVVAIASRRRSAAADLAAEFEIPVVHDDVAALLADPDVDVVDIATGVDGRVALIEQAVRAGKHVLAQKPLLVDEAELPRLRSALLQADAAGIRVAVNQNARWAPVWRAATLLVRDGAIGDVVGVTHLHDKPLPPLGGTPFDDLPHMLITDYLVHWIDITRCWLEGNTVSAVWADDGRVPGQPEAAKNPWRADLRVTTVGGASAAIRVVGDAESTAGGCPFWIHGTRGTIRGSILRDTDRLDLDRGGVITTIPISGQWFTDGFAGTMGELMDAVRAGREPENSARQVLATVELGFAALRSVQQGGTPDRPDGLVLHAAEATEGKSE